MGRHILAFLIHLRLHYQLLVLPGGYLLGGLFAPELATTTFVLQFFAVHVLLNGGVTAYNSWCDEDEGPIGGLERPPPMTPWMGPAALLVQAAGLPLAWPLGGAYVGLWLATMVLSVCYSARPLRWKGHPLLSLVAVGVGTGTNTFLMGYLAAGGPGLDATILAAALGVALLLLALYPASQVYQIEEDGRRGDRTFAVAFGLPGVRRFFLAAYPAGLGLASLVLATTRPAQAAALFTLGTAGGLIAWRQLAKLEGRAQEYRAVMGLKYRASLSFVAFLVVALFWAHGMPR